MKNFSVVVWCFVLLAPLPCVRAESPKSVDKTPAVSAEHTQYLEELATLRGNGYPTTLAEIYPAAPKDGSNAAPIYIDEIAKIPETADEDAALAVTKSTATSADWEKAEAFLGNNAKLLDAVHRAASMSVCVVDGRSTAVDPAAIAFPELAPMRRAARLLSIESTVMAHRGNTVEAVHNAALGFQVSGQAYQNPSLIGYLVGVAIDAITLNEIEHIMASSASDPAVVAAADQAVSDGWRSHAVTDSLRGELVSSIAEMEFIKHPSADELKQVYSSPGAPAEMRAAVKSPAAWSDFVDGSSIVIMRYFEALITDAGEPYPVASPAIKALDDDIQTKDGGDHTFSHILCPVFTGVVDKQDLLESRAAIVHASAALFTYKSAHGSYPGALDQAMTDVPVDPFDGGSIGYRPDGEGFVLYSVGPTGKFAGGASTGPETVLRVAADGTVAWK